MAEFARKFLQKVARQLGYTLTLNVLARPLVEQ